MTDKKQTIECKAVVAWAPNEPLTVETITVAPPRRGEVRIKILFTSVCQTDQHTIGGRDPLAVFPCILGHEAAGVVESVGEGVTSVEEGDHVVPLYFPQCRECKFCKNPKTNLCVQIRWIKNAEFQFDAETPFSCKGKPIYHYMGTSTFSEYTVMPDNAVAKVDPKAPLDRVCLLGCGLSTGYGAALNAANVQPGDTVAIFGLGSVGLAVAMGCIARKASRIIGVDINDDKFKLAESFGITEFVNPNKLDANVSIQDKLIEMTDGGLDHTFECVGNVKLMRSALEATHIGWGQALVIGVAPAGHEIIAYPFHLVCGRKWFGCGFGGWKSRDSLPRLVDAYLKNELFDIDKFITHRRQGIESIPEAFEILRSGKSLRCVIGI